MLARLGSFVVRRKRLTLVGVLLLTIAAAVFGGGVARNLIAGGFEPAGAESVRAEGVLEDSFGQQQPNVVLVVTADDGDVNSDQTRAAGTEITEFVAGFEHVDVAVSYWTLGDPPPLRGTDGDNALVMAHVEGDDTEAIERSDELVDALEEQGIGGDAVTVQAGGLAVVDSSITHTIESDLRTAEMIAIPVTLVLLVWVFGSIVAALLPLAVGIFSIISTFAVLQLFAQFTDVSIFALNATTALGLGLAIDYSLFIVSRYREELAGGYAPGVAVVRTVRTAGRTILFSAITVAIGLSAMLVFPIPFMRSFGYAGIGVAATAAFGAVVLLPALLAVLGHRVEKGRVFKRRPVVDGEGVWHRVAVFVMRRPLPVATAVIALLLLLGAPFLGIRLGTPDDRVLAPGADVRDTHDILREDYAAGEAATVQVVVPQLDDPATAPGLGGAQDHSADIAAYAAELSALDGVARVDALTGSYVDGTEAAPPGAMSLRFANEGGTWFSVVPEVEPLSADGEELVNDVRALESPFEEVLVGGQSAAQVDSKDVVFQRLPWAIGLVAVTTFVVLFMLFGSVLVPLKALVLNFLSLTATFGAMVFIFQDGNGSGLLDFTATGDIAVAMPILMFCIAFGLSMDYEVFLLSRIKEEHDSGSDTVTSVARGLERTGRIVTAAAVLIAVVFIAFAVGNVSFMKMFGIGLTLAVLVDAFLIRSTLVPAFMRLAGDANWWAPGPLRRLHNRFGIAEHVDLDDELAELTAAEASTDRVLEGAHRS
jgi:putative drug exporter of the RND superfamily